MRRAGILIFAVFMGVFLVHSKGVAEDKPIQKGDPFPVIRLPVPTEIEYGRYLGINKDHTFTMRDIQARVVIIEVFHSG